MASVQLTSTAAGGARVWRIGFRPEPWAWSGWEWSTDGRFPGRWDDLHGNFRTVYAGSSLLDCLLEVLAGFRLDARIAAELEEIVEDGEDAVLHPTVPPGQVPREWLDARAASSAELAGAYCAVTDSRSIATLYPHFIGVALGLGLTDFDAAALKDARPRRLTQANRRLDLREHGPRRPSPSPPVTAMNCSCGPSSNDPATALSARSCAAAGPRNSTTTVTPSGTPSRCWG